MANRKNGKTSPDRVAAMNRKSPPDRPRYDLIPVEVLEGVARVFGHGAAKYEDNDWQRGINTSNHYRAVMGHMADWRMGKETDAESGYHHLDHALARLIMLRYQTIYPEYTKFDDVRARITAGDVE